MARSFAYIKNRNPGIRKAARRKTDAHAVLMREAHAISARTTRRLAQATPKATGRTAMATDYDIVTQTRKNITSHVTQPAHAEYLDKGTRPHPVSGWRLVNWARAKMGGDPIQAAFALAQAIAERGTRGYNYSRGPIREARQTTAPQVRSAILTHLRTVLRK